MESLIARILEFKRQYGYKGCENVHYAIGWLRSEANRHSKHYTSAEVLELLEAIVQEVKNENL